MLNLGKGWLRFRWREHDSDAFLLIEEKLALGESREWLPFDLTQEGNFFFLFRSRHQDFIWFKEDVGVIVYFPLVGRRRTGVFKFWKNKKRWVSV